jgi:hypothetical protein
MVHSQINLNKFKKLLFRAPRPELPYLFNPQTIKMLKKKAKKKNIGPRIALNCGPFDLQSDVLPTDLGEFEIPPRLITTRMVMLYQEVCAGKKTRKLSMAG